MPTRRQSPRPPGRKPSAAGPGAKPRPGKPVGKRPFAGAKSAKAAAARPTVKPRTAQATNARVKAPRPGLIVDAGAAKPDSAPGGSPFVQTVEVRHDEADMRVDRFLRSRFPALSFVAAQKLLRTGQVRVDGARAKPAAHVSPGQSVRIPPIHEQGEGPARPSLVWGGDLETVEFLRSITLFETDDVLVLNKPYGLAVQGGSGTTRHVDGLLDALRDRSGQKPRLVHRIDKDTAGCLVIAKTRLVASELAKTFRSRSARKTYWAVAAGVPRVPQGRISTYLAKENVEGGDARMRIAEHGDKDAAHALTYYAVVDTVGQKASWLSLKPVTGRTHQLRAHAAHIGHPILGDPKYFDIENWEQLGGIQNRLHLLARRIALPLPGGGALDVSAPLPPHMLQTFNLFGFDASAYDPIAEAPSE